MRKNRRKRWPWIVATLLITLSAAVPIAHVAVPAVHQWWMLNKLTSDDPAVRVRGQQYVLTIIDKHPDLVDGVVDGAIERLDDVENPAAFDELVALLEQIGAFEENRVPIEPFLERMAGAETDLRFLVLVDALERVGLWSSDAVPQGYRLRRLTILAGDPEPDARVIAAQRLADMAAAAGDETTLAAMEKLIADESAEVRFNALAAVAELYGAAATQGNDDARQRYEAMLRSRLDDDEETIAANAWMIMGLLRRGGVGGGGAGEADGGAAWPDVRATFVRPIVAEAALWATAGRLKTQKIAVEAAGDASIDPVIRAMAIYVAGRGGGGAEARPSAESSSSPSSSPSASLPAGRDALIAIFEPGPQAVTADNAILFWRAALAMPLPPAPGHSANQPRADHPGYRALLHFLTAATKEDFERVECRAVILACLFRDARLIFDVGEQGGPLFDLRDDPRILLAMYEGRDRAVHKANTGDANAANANDGHAQKSDTTDNGSPRGASVPPLPAPPADAAPTLRLAAIRAGVIEPDRQTLIELMLVDDPELRDLAAVTAAQLLTQQQAAALVARMWRPPDPSGDDRSIYRFNDHAKRSGAILAGLTDAAPALLAQAADDFAANWAVHQIVLLGRWMQGADVKPKLHFASKGGTSGSGDQKASAENDGKAESSFDMARYAVTIMSHEDIPESTVLLALLHRREVVALDILLQPRRDRPADLLPRLIGKRWQRVLDHALPADAPRLTVWADPELARFQIDLLRWWYALNRYRLKTQGW